MARIIGGIGASHTPTIGFAKDNKTAKDPDWKAVFDVFSPVTDWLKDKQPDILFFIYNDHITSFFFDHYSPFVLGVDDQYETADEGGGAREYPPVAGHKEFARHIGSSLFADEFDLSFFQKKPIDHGLFSPLSMMTDRGESWDGAVVPFQVGLLQFPAPTAKRCFDLGVALRRAIESYPENLTVAVVATGGLSHQVHGERCGFLNIEWDNRFLDLLERCPQELTKLTQAEYMQLAGAEGAESIMWLIMRGALSSDVHCVHRQMTAPSMTNIVTLIYEDTGLQPETEIEGQLQHVNAQLQGAENIEGTYPFTLERANKAWVINDFLHRLIHPEHRERFLNDTEALFDEFGLSDEEKNLIRQRDWIGLIRYGVIFFSLEKMAAVLGLGNPDIYCQMRGETLEEFLKSRNLAIKYSVGAEKD